MLKIVILGMTGRPLTHNIIEGIIKSEFDLQKVILQKRFTNRGNLLRFFKNSLKKHGVSFITSRIFEIIRHKNINTKEICLKNKISYSETDNINSKEVQNQLEQIQPDVIVLAGPPIIKENIFSQAKLFTINSHRSLLPKYAGLDAIFWALYHNEKEIGATVHTVNKGIDSGEIIIQRKKTVKECDNLETLTNWYYKTAPELIIESLNMISSNQHNFKKQDKSKRTYFSWPTKQQRKELNARFKKHKSNN